MVHICFFSNFVVERLKSLGPTGEEKHVISWFKQNLEAPVIACLGCQLVFLGHIFHLAIRCVSNLIHNCLVLSYAFILFFPVLVGRLSDYPNMFETACNHPGLWLPKLSHEKSSCLASRSSRKSPVGVSKRPAPPRVAREVSSLQVGRAGGGG